MLQSSMILIVGLGNPGKEYQNTRHSLGHQVIEKIIVNHNLTLQNQPKLQAHISDFGQIKLAVLDCYMNESGLPIRKIADYFKIPLENIYLIHDDLDLPAGEWKLQFDRGPAGHNGIKSTIEHLGTQAFHRFRVGIGHPPEFIPVEDYVLKPFTSEEKVIINETIDKIVKEIENLGH